MGVNLFFMLFELIFSIGVIVLMLVVVWGDEVLIKMILILLVVLLVVVGFVVVMLIIGYGVVFDGFYCVDVFVVFVKCLIYFVMGVCILIVLCFFVVEWLKFEYLVLILFVIVGVGMMVLVIDLIIFYIGFEL